MIMHSTAVSCNDTCV